jgi:hypothetical protein
MLARGGVIAGTSAGASIMGNLMITGGNPVARVGEGFGLLPGVVIDQHFSQRNRLDRLLGVLVAHPGYVGLGIDENTAVVIEGHTLRVLGEHDVRLCLSQAGRSDVRVLNAGASEAAFNPGRSDLRVALAHSGGIVQGYRPGLLHGVSAELTSSLPIASPPDTGHALGHVPFTYGGGDHLRGDPIAAPPSERKVQHQVAERSSP